MPAVKRAWLGGLACAGVAAAHWIAYLIAPPDGHSHAEGMAATGHKLWPYFVALAAGAFVAALSGFVSDRFCEAPGASGWKLWRHSVSRLLPAQVLAFFCLELAERALFADPGHGASLVTEPVLWVGIALQVLCALAGAGLLVLFARTVELIQELVTRQVHTAAPLRLARPVLARLTVRPLVMATGGPTFRGPPVLL